MLCIQKCAKVHGKPELYLLLFTMYIRDMPDQSHIKVRSMQRSGTEVIRTQTHAPALYMEPPVVGGTKVYT